MTAYFERVKGECKTHILSVFTHYYPYNVQMLVSGGPPGGGSFDSWRGAAPRPPERTTCRKPKYNPRYGITLITIIGHCGLFVLASFIRAPTRVLLAHARLVHFFLIFFFHTYE